MRVKIIDAPSGWRFGFPKQIPEDVKDIITWLIDNGYPKKEIDRFKNSNGEIEHFIYRTWYEEGLAPTAKSFLYHDDSEISQYIIKIMETDTEISLNWKAKFEVKTPTREELYKEEVSSTFNYLKLRKIKRLISENQTALEKSTDSNQQLLLMQTHQYLKKLEAEIMASNGTVIYK